METKQDVFDYLAAKGIAYERHDHPPVFTLEEACKLDIYKDNGSVNLFMRTNNGKSHFLVMLHKDTNLSIQQISAALGTKRLGFASPRRLKEHLGVEPGSVSFLALANDTEQKVAVWVDQNIIDTGIVHAHPLQNDCTCLFSTESFLAYLKSTGHEPRLFTPV